MMLESLFCFYIKVTYTTELFAYFCEVLSFSGNLCYHFNLTYAMSLLLQNFNSQKFRYVLVSLMFANNQLQVQFELSMCKNTG